MRIRTLGVALVALAPVVTGMEARAQAPAAPVAAQPAPEPPPEVEVGRIAPDFTLQWADSAGVRSEPVKLSALRGNVVVVAFYPLDRSSGCTAQLTKFRDEFAAIFGQGTILLPISVDSVATHASWAAEMRFPFALAADPDLAVAKQYGSLSPTRPQSTRTVFLIGRDGRILWRNMRFGALNENAYSELAREVAKARDGG